MSKEAERGRVDRTVGPHETRSIAVPAYRDSEGAPTCCADWETARCPFLMLRKMGLVEVCGVTGKDIQRGPAGLQPGEFAEEPSKHMLRPVTGCPVWPNAELSGAAAKE
jgi:hypothetical protein